MPRKLLASQTKILNEQAKAGKRFFDELDNETITKLEQINDYETLHWDVDRYLNDAFFKAEYGGQ